MVHAPVIAHPKPLSTTPEPPALTLELIARAYPAAAWQGLQDDPNAVPQVPEPQLRHGLAAFMAQHRPAADLPLFGYGSLLWHPEPGTRWRSLATLLGWQRSFCLWQWAYRGTRAAPGLMLAIIPGSACVGALFDFDRPVDAETLWPVWRRELIGNGYRPAIVRVTTDSAEVDALTFIANTDSPRYAPGLSRAIAARSIAQGVGPRGPSAEYLCRTTSAYRHLGVVDAELDELSTLVADCLEQRLGKSP